MNNLNIGGQIIVVFDEHTSTLAPPKTAWINSFFGISFGPLHALCTDVVEDIYCV